MYYVDIGGQGPGLVPPEQALVPVGDRGFLYGDGLFETVLLRDGRLPLLACNLARLAASAAALGIPCDRGRVREGVLAVARTMPATGEFAVRITLSRGPAGPRGYQPPPDPHPTLVITAVPYHRPAGPLSAITSSIRVDQAAPGAGHKTLSALEKVLARAESARAGCDEALLLNRNGRVAEAAACTVFIVRQGLWLTPPLTDGALPGVMRRRVLQLSGGVEWPLTPDDLSRCDGVYLTNALMGCLPLAALDGRGLPWGAAPAFAGRLFEEAE